MVLTDEPLPDAESRSVAIDEPTHRLEQHSAVEDDADESSFLCQPLAGDELTAGTRVGRYSVLEPLGEGGMGVIYEAWDPQLDRRVALKVLRTSRPERSSPGSKLLAEAQTLAKIEHPNIVTVYDAGVSDERVFIAMELCRGHNLHQWLTEKEHGVRDIIDVFVSAGRGLVAAHDAGVVHRDFKPANVLIGRDGSIKVADFGMAHLMELAVDVDTSAVTSTSDPNRSVSTIVGTPTYMAPEQLLGRLGDHRMDQFSFCLCLYWALLGHPPFPGRTFQERRRTVPMGMGKTERERLNRARRIPVRVRRALLRGLSVEPDDRFESMAALLGELTERRMWPLALSVSMLTMGLGLGALLMAEVQPNPCRNSEEALGDAWDLERRQEVAAVFARTGRPEAVDQLARVVGAFDRYAGGWKDTYSMMCEATYVKRTLSETNFNLGMHCLERHRGQLEVAVQTVVNADDAQELDARMSVPFMMPAVEECRDDNELKSVALLPGEGPEATRINDLLKTIDMANALREAGELAEGIAVATAAVAQAREIDHISVLAQALECLGRLQADGAAPQAAEKTLQEAIQAGSRGADDRIVARAWPSLLYAKVMQSQLAGAESLIFPAALAVDKAGDERARGWLYNTLGALHSELGQLDLAQTALVEAIRVKSRLGDPQDFDVGITWNNLGAALNRAGRWEEASEAFAQVQSILAATVGPTHPLNHIVETGLCQVEIGRKHYDVALALCEHALEGLAATSSSPVLMSRVERHTADALVGLGRVREAIRMIEHARARVKKINPQMVKELGEWLATPRGVPSPHAVHATPQSPAPRADASP